MPLDENQLRPLLINLSAEDFTYLRSALAYGTLPAGGEALGRMGLLTEDGRIRPGVERIAARLWAEELLWNDPVDPPKFGPDPNGPGVIRDLFALFGLAARRRLPLTQQGSLHKTAEDDWVALAEEPAQVVRGPMQAFVLEYARRRGLVAPAAYPSKSGQTARSGLVPTALAEEWAAQSWGAIWADMLAFLLEQWRDRFQALHGVLLVLATAPAGAWLAARPWRVQLDMLADGENRPTAGGQAFRDFEFYLMGLDLVQMAGSRQSGPLVRATPALHALMAGGVPDLPAPADRFDILPDMEIAAPKQLPPLVLYGLERLAERQSAGEELRYRLTAAGVRRAAEEGWEPGSLIEFIAGHCKTPLPPAALARLQSWASRGSHARFESVTLLRLSDAGAAARAAADRAVKGHIIAALSPTDLIIDATAVEPIRRRLAELGLEVEPGVLQPERPDRSRRQPGRRADRPVRRIPASSGPSGQAGLPVAPETLVQAWFGGPLQPGAPLAPAAPLSIKPVAPASLEECAEMLRRSAEARAMVRITYDGDGTRRTYTVRPLRVLDDRLMAYCEETGEQSRFKLSRIGTIEPLG